MVLKNATFRLTEEFEDQIYPDSDGKPMGETDYHIAALVYLRESLQGFFRDQQNVYVTTNMFLYYEEGNLKARKAPDVMIVRGVDKHFRRSFKLWREAAGPQTIIEVVSRKTWKEDLKEKPKLYARLQVSEYFVFDPEGRVLDPPLQGFRRRGQAMVKRRLEADGSLVSKALGLRLVPEGYLPRLIGLAHNQPLWTAEELAAQVEAAEQELKQLRAQHGQGR